MDLKIADRTAVVTGGAGSIGTATARTLLNEGARVVLTDLEADALQQTAAALDADGDRVLTVSADLSKPDATAVLRTAVCDDAGWTVDILVHAAGVTGAKGDPLRDITEEDWVHAWQTDFMSGVRAAKAFVPGMLERGWGRVVFVTSENATQPYHDEVVYNTAKAALLSFTKGLAQAYGPQGVLVNAVAPAFIATNMTDEMMEQRADEKDMTFDEAVETFLEEERPHLVLDRRGRPEEVAVIIALLCSERASFVAGANYRVDGGSVLALDT
jgi:NAD(P)-dependent dehydrogenase (short-subunit alcohol dehydrogenase family)